MPAALGQEHFLERLSGAGDGRVFLLADEGRTIVGPLEEAIRVAPGGWKLVHVRPASDFLHEHAAWKRETAGIRSALGQFLGHPVRSLRLPVFWLLEDGEILGWGRTIERQWRAVGFRPALREIPPGDELILNEGFLAELVKLRLHEMEDPSGGPQDGLMDPEDVRRCFYGYERTGREPDLLFRGSYSWALFSGERVEACWDRALVGGLLLSEAVQCTRAHRIGDNPVRLELLLERPRKAIACSRMDARAPELAKRCGAFMEGLPDPVRGEPAD